jgi:hypothetical protein
MAAAGGGAEKEAIRTKIRIQMNIRDAHFGFENIIYFTPLFAQSPTPPGIEFPLTGKPEKPPPRWKGGIHFLLGRSVNSRRTIDKRSACGEEGCEEIANSGTREVGAFHRLLG